MTPTSSVVFCLAYIVGLLSTVVPWGDFGILVLGIGAAILSWRRRAITAWIQRAIPLQFRQAELNSKVWLIAGFVGLLAALHLQIRMPQPGAKDISRLVSPATTMTQQQAIPLVLLPRFHNA